MNRPELMVIIGLLIVLLVLVLSILWFILPFAVLGTKKKLDEIINERQKNVIQFGRIVAQGQKINARLAEILTESRHATACLSEMKPAINNEEPATVHNDPPETGPGESESGDKRKHPRLEFHSFGKMMGENATVRDISKGGLFVELDNIPDLLKIGQVTNLALDLPTENGVSHYKVKIASQTGSGVGCKFIELTPENQQAIENCFEEFRDTLPIRDLEEDDGSSIVDHIADEAIAPYSGNTSVKVFHKLGCRYYECQNCTAKFRAREDAVSAGYSPCGICNP